MKVYEIVADQIIEKLEQGTVPWQKPWTGAAGMPKNAISEKEYRGVNAFTLDNPDYETNYWITAKQAKQAGGAIKTGEPYSLIVFWKWIEDKKDKTNTFPILRFYKGWNLDQTDGLEALKAKLQAKDTERTLHFKPIEAAENILKTYKGKPSIEHKGDRACYSPVLDSIHMPPKERFNGVNEYYSTLFHELGHSTGHKDRLNRSSLMDANFFGSHEYSKEELVAELAASFVCRVTGIDNTLDNSAAYIKSWLKELKNDKKYFTTACAQAMKAADLMRGTTFEN